MLRDSRLRRTSFLAALVCLGALAGVAAAEPTLKSRAVWAHPRDAGTSGESVTAFVEQPARAHVDTVVMEVRGRAGRPGWTPADPLREDRPGGPPDRSRTDPSLGWPARPRD
jgi:hypothetical protein